MLVCGFPVLEVLFSIVRRRRRNLSPGDPDCLHLHSLVKRRVARALLPNASTLVRNSATGTIMWFAVLVPAVIAVSWPTQTGMLVLCFVVCAVLYTVAYARLTQFCWFWKVRTLPAQNSKSLNSSKP